MPIRPEMEAILMMRPARFFMKSAYRALIIKNVPLRFTLSTASKSSGVMRRASLSRVMPALFTRMSTPPSASLIWATAAVTWS